MSSSSIYFDRFERIFDAQFPRFNKNATIPPNSNHLKIVVDHYKLRSSLKSPERKPINLYLLHGTGMTKAIWRYYAKRLYEFSETESPIWQIDNIIAMDLVTHGESAMFNMGKLGYEYDWRDGARDLVKIASELNLQGDNIAIGHSMGGFQSVYAAFLAPTLFKFVVPIEAVLNQSENSRKRFKGLLPALNKVITTEFRNEVEYETFMKKKSFYTGFNKEILDDFIKAEKWVHPDGTVSTKTSKQQQMLGYYVGGFITPIALEVVHNIFIPIVHVIGSEATWNEKESVELIRNGHINVLDAVDIKGGQHLVNGEQPDEVIKVLISSFNKYIKRDEDSDFQNSKPLSSKDYNATFKTEYAKIESSIFTKKKPAKL